MASKKNKGKNRTGTKVVVKTTLENPFSLALPVISEELENEVISAMESCCSNLKLTKFKPCWKDICKLRGKERVEYTRKYREEHLAKLHSDAVAAENYELVKEVRSHLIFGYNAVMRALEQTKLVGVIVRKDVNPSILVQTFLPGCLHKQIPLVPLTGLPELLKKEDMLAVKHRVMVLGLKPSVQETSCRFYPLYKSMLKVWEGLGQNHEQLEQYTDDLFSDKENYNGNSEENMDISVVANQEASEENASAMQYNIREEDSKSTPRKQDLVISKCTITPEEVIMYHLKRSEKSRRVFVPVKKDLTILNQDEDVISVVSDQDEDVISVFSKQDKDVGVQSSKAKSPPKEDKKTTVERDTDFVYEFFIDATGSENITESNVLESKNYLISQDVLGLEQTKTGSAVRGLEPMKAGCVSPKNKDRDQWRDKFRDVKKRKTIKETTGTDFQIGSSIAGGSQFQFNFSISESEDKDTLREGEGSTKEMRPDEEISRKDESNTKEMTTDEDILRKDEGITKEMRPKDGDIGECHKKSDINDVGHTPKEKKQKVSSDGTPPLIFTYIPAKTKRIKSNPSRKGKKKK